MSENRSNDTGQISVAELLARNGQKVGTRAGGRRRRGASGGISVAELTGEIPITRAADDRADSKGERHTAADAESAAGQSDSASSAAATDVRTPPKVAPAPRKAETPNSETPKLETPKTATFALSDIEKTTVTPRVAVETKTPPPKAGTGTPAVTKRRPSRRRR
ncbi:hypothetical protein NJ76_03650, partial [Rhodococcus sp. IITR03]